MKLLDRYIGKVIASSILLVAAILIAAFTFFEFIDELDNIGLGNYGISQIAEFSLLRAPSLAYEIFPIAALVGSLIGLGNLVANNEMVVIRASGVSLQRTIFAVMKAALAIVVIALIVGELIAPVTEQLARQRRAFARYDQMTFDTKQGLWMRDGQSYVNIEKVLPDNRVAGVYIYEFDSRNRLQASTHAKSAQYANSQWMLHDIQQTVFQPNQVTNRTIKQATWKSPFRPNMVNMVAIEAQNLSTWDLTKYIRYLRENEQNTQRYEQALWVKIIYPAAAAVMVFLAIPIVLASLKNVSIGRRVVIGSFIGLAFHITNQAMGHVGVVYGLWPALIIPLPTIVTLLVGVGLMRRIS